MEKLPGGPVIRTLWFHCRGPGLITVWRTKILQAAQHSQKKKQFEGKEEKIKIDKDNLYLIIGKKSISGNCILSVCNFFFWFL